MKTKVDKKVLLKNIYPKIGKRKGLLFSAGMLLLIMVFGGDFNISPSTLIQSLLVALGIYAFIWGLVYVVTMVLFAVIDWQYKHTCQEWEKERQQWEQEWQQWRRERQQAVEDCLKAFDTTVARQPFDIEVPWTAIVNPKPKQMQ